MPQVNLSKVSRSQYKLTLCQLWVFEGWGWGFGLLLLELFLSYFWGGVGGSWGFNCHEIYVLALSVNLKRINPHETDIKKHYETSRSHPQQSYPFFSVCVCVCGGLLGMPAYRHII